VAGADGRHARKESGITVTGTSPRLIAWRGEVCLYLRECGLARCFCAAFIFRVAAMMAMFFATFCGIIFMLIEALRHKGQTRYMGW